MCHSLSKIDLEDNFIYRSGVSIPFSARLKTLIHVTCGSNFDVTTQMKATENSFQVALLISLKGQCQGEFCHF